MRQDSYEYCRLFPWLSFYLFIYSFLFPRVLQRILHHHHTGAIWGGVQYEGRSPREPLPAKIKLPPLMFPPFSVVKRGGGRGETIEMIVVPVIIGRGTRVGKGKNE